MSDQPQSGLDASSGTADAPAGQGSNIHIRAERDVAISGDVIGRDKIVNNIQNIVQRALSAAAEAEQAQSIEAKRLAQGVSAFLQHLQTRASKTTDTTDTNPYK